MSNATQGGGGQSAYNNNIVTFNWSKLIKWN